MARGSRHYGTTSNKRYTKEHADRWMEMRRNRSDKPGMKITEIAKLEGINVNTILRVIEEFRYV